MIQLNFFIGLNFEMNKRKKLFLEGRCDGLQHKRIEHSGVWRPAIDRLR